MKKDKPSATASLILKVVLFESQEDKLPPMVAPETVQFSKQIANHVIQFPQLFLFLITNPVFRWIIKSCEKILNPGFILHVVTRKKFIEKLAMEAIAKGCTQIIILGGGYDVLSLRISIAKPEIMCFEVDHPNTQKLKLTSLASMTIPSNLKFISANLAQQSIGEVLRQEPTFDASKMTLIIIEGVLMYLEAEEVEKLCKQLSNIFTHGLQCIFTLMDSNPNEDIQFKTAHPLVNWWLKQKSEKFLWGISPNELPSFMKKMGFEHIKIVGKNEFLKEYFSHLAFPPQLAEGELICTMTKSGPSIM